MVVRSDAPDSLKRALTGAWYEVMAQMSSGSKAGASAIEQMAVQAGATVAEFKAQLKTTAMFYEAAEGARFARSDVPAKTMEQVRSFAFAKGLYGERAASKDLVGIEFADGSVIGDTSNVKLRFTADYMQLAADGKL